MDKFNLSFTALKILQKEIVIDNNNIILNDYLEKYSSKQLHLDDNFKAYELDNFYKEFEIEYENISIQNIISMTKENQLEFFRKFMIFNRFSGLCGGDINKDYIFLKYFCMIFLKDYDYEYCNCANGFCIHLLNIRDIVDVLFSVDIDVLC